MANRTQARLLLPLRSSLLLLCLALSAPGAADGQAPTSTSAGRPGCPTTCGAVDIPYPFGIGERCAIHNGFALHCNETKDDEHGATKMRPFTGNVEVTRISIPDSKIWVKTPISSRCYDPRGLTTTSNEWRVNFTGTPFWFSVDNKIFVIGCNTLAYMWGAPYVIGCSPTCNSTLVNSTCSGAGCCAVDVPKNIWSYQGYLNQQDNITNSEWPCGYMVLMENSAFKFDITYLTSTVFNDTHGGEVPTVMDWHITPWSCESAKGNMSSYACVSSNSECDNSTDQPGYRCKCSSGYKGNPYIKDGCTDIDECLDKASCPCPGICENTLGHYTCSCPRGNQMVRGVCMADQKSIWVMPVVGASVGIVVLVVFISCACLIQERRKLRLIKQKHFRQHGGLLLFEEMKSQQGVAFTIFSEEDLQQATSKFDEKQVIGYGGHGTVYKGLLKGTVEVAVKRCKTIDEQQKKEFGKEMLILSQINHRNIVKLLGCCLEVEVPILVYEFIPNGTLFQLIHGNHNRHIPLGTRLRIAHESAEALAYLHSWASPPILHGDVKSSNILLDGDNAAKVSDFGASILAPTDESQFVTLVQGTCGYLDPEYMQTCQLTDKSDVYSFGVVLLELLTRKKAFNLDAPEHEKSLSMRFLSAMKESKLEEVLDDEIKGEENTEFLEEIAELAKQCLEMCSDNRPSMKEIAEKLDRLRKVMQHPWAQQNPEEIESLLGESSYVASSMVGTTGNFSIEKKAVKGLESGR